MSRRVAILEIHSSFLAETLLRGHPLRAISSNAPADLAIIDIRPPDHRIGIGTFSFLVESASFAEVPEGAVPPNWEPTFTVTMSEHDGLLAAMTRCPACPNCTGPDHYAAVRGITR